MLATTKMSTRGQIVIPEIIREKLGLREGSEFIVIEESDHIILKIIRKPPKEELAEILDKAHDKARKLGISEKDVLEAIKESRKAKREK